jgi:IS30 family transposase
LRVERRRWRRLDRELRQKIVRLAAQGATYREILDQVDTSSGAITIALRDWGGVTRSDVEWEPSPARLSLEERLAIKVGLELGGALSAIARSLGRAPSTVCREVNANGGRDQYRPAAAHARAARCARRPKATKLRANPELCERVIADLHRLWSPEQIGIRLRAEFADRPEMWVSHETIYKSLYIQGRGELRRELARCLRSGRAQRRPQGRVERRGRIADMVMISERPAEVEDRAVPGHWEGDLLIGKDNKSAIATLVERATRYVVLAKIPNQRAETVRRALVDRVHTLPSHLWRSLTWDQGGEMAQHRLFSIETGIDVYFCDPHSPWQRGSNENTNGLLRQYFPKGTSLSRYSQEHLDAVAVQLNGRPRQTLGWQTPAERLTELIATTG